MTFKYTALTKSGERVEGEVEASDRVPAMRVVERLGYTPISIMLTSAKKQCRQCQSEIGMPNKGNSKLTSGYGTTVGFRAGGLEGEEYTRPCMELAAGPPPLPKAPPQDEDVMRKLDWFIVFQTTGRDWRMAGKKTFVADLRSGIVSGLIKSDSVIETHAKDAEGAWSKTSVCVREFAQGHFKLRAMYEPVWAHAMSGLIYGAFIGAGLKILHTMGIFIFAELPEFAFGMLAALLWFSPRVYGWVKVLLLLACAQVVKQAGFGFITGSLIANATALITGAVLGGLPGMAIGATIGFVRKGSLPRSPDAPPEPGGMFLKTVVLPGLGTIAVWAIWLCVISRWIADTMEG